MLTPDQKWFEVDRIVERVNKRREGEDCVICKTNAERYIDNNFNPQARD